MTEREPVSVVLCAATLCLLLVAAPRLPTAAAADSLGDAKDLQVDIGVGGVWKLGQVCPVRITVPSGVASKVRSIEAQTVDGDGIDVVYRQEIDNPKESGVFWISVRIGRIDAALVLRIYGDEKRLLYELEAPLKRGLPSDQPLILAVGDSMGVQELNRSTAEGVDAIFTTSLVASPELLPIHWRDLGSCDLLIISTADLDFLRGIRAEQWSAIDTWINRGGGCVLSLSGERDLVDAINDLSGLQDLLPGRLSGVGQVSDPGVLESLVGTTEDPLGSISAVLLEQPSGKVELTFSDTLAREVPWWISYAHGHGTIRAIASDLGGSSFAAWKDRKLVWALLLSEYLERDVLQGTGSEQQVGEISYLGYGDLVGQLRATLDVFSSVREISFGQVAAMLIGVLLLIGPLDYLVSVKWLQRPDFSWYLSGTLLIAISIGLTLWYAALRPDTIYVNSAQIIDIDTRNGRLSGRLWSHVYSGHAHKLDVRASEQEPRSPVALDWQGLPGSGLGGLLSQLNTDRGIPSYFIDRSAAGDTSLRSVGVPAAGTKCLTGAWESQLDLKFQSSLKEISGVDQLTGELVNPLDEVLYEPMLFYHNWYYGLQSQIPPGGRVAISFDTIPRDLTRRLNGRKNVDGNDTITRWDPAARNALDRLLELMMFHKAASGRAYTSLTHRYQPHVDQSNLLQTDRAFLVGRLETSPVSLAVSCTDFPDLEVTPDLTRIWCRISIPVEPGSASP